MNSAKVLSLILCLLLASVASASGSSTKLNGYLEWKHGDEMIVEGQRVVVTASTKFKGEGEAKSVATIPLGYEMRLEGERQPDGIILIKKMEAKPNGDAMFENDLKQGFNAIEAEFLKLGHLQEGGKDIGKLYTSGPEVDRVRKITARIVPTYLKPEDFRVYVVDNPEWNAMAAPNRSIYVFSGLLKDMDDDEVAIVLGHELVHATHEHSRRLYKKQMWISLGTSGAQELANSAVESGVSQEILSQATALGSSAWSNGYGREHEDQADRVGLRYAYEGGYDVTKGPGLWAKFAKKYGDQDKVSNFFFGNHSVAVDRERNLQKELETNYKKSQIK
jgi:Zn-dependent protease with chaperone function